MKKLQQSELSVLNPYIKDIRVKYVNDGDTLQVDLILNDDCIVSGRHAEDFESAREDAYKGLYKYAVSNGWIEEPKTESPDVAQGQILINDASRYYTTDSVISFITKPRNPILAYFKYDHLPDHLKAVSKPLCDLANQMHDQLDESPEKSAGLRKLLEAKDCFVRAAVDQKDLKLNMGNVSDGDHTFDELYFHRMTLFSVICHTYNEHAWKSKLHSDGTMYDGYFIVGIETPSGQFTYHCKLSWWSAFSVKELDKAPEWDGHTSNDIKRLHSLLRYTKYNLSFHEGDK